MSFYHFQLGSRKFNAFIPDPGRTGQKINLILRDFKKIGLLVLLALWIRKHFFFSLFEWQYDRERESERQREIFIFWFSPQMPTAADD